jgi:hypothetical protein
MLLRLYRDGSLPEWEDELLDSCPRDVEIAGSSLHLRLWDTASVPDLGFVAVNSATSGLSLFAKIKF